MHLHPRWPHFTTNTWLSPTLLAVSSSDSGVWVTSASSAASANPGQLAKSHLVVVPGKQPTMRPPAQLKVDLKRALPRPLPKPTNRGLHPPDLTHDKQSGI